MEFVTCPAPEYRICFLPVSESDRSVAFPCDSNGQVNLDFLKPREKNNYLFARAMRGRNYAAEAITRPG